MICIIAGVLTVAVLGWLLSGCAGTPEVTARWYLSDKPAELRVPVSGQTDPGAVVVPGSEE
ncbi:MAG: hypothetical protein N2595_07580 [bacterium]|nr:hypothetical protein [bacterium]